MYKLISILTVLLLVTACNKNRPSQIDSTDVTEPVGQNTIENSPTRQSLCGSAPLIQDRRKLERTLLKKNIINEAMSTEEKDKAIREYIHKRNAEYQLCVKTEGKSS